MPHYIIYQAVHDFAQMVDTSWKCYVDLVSDLDQTDSDNVNSMAELK